MIGSGHMSRDDYLINLISTLRYFCSEICTRLSIEKPAVKLIWVAGGTPT